MNTALCSYDDFADLSAIYRTNKRRVVTTIQRDISIFLRLTAELAGKYALIVIFVCLCVGMWGILAGVYILAVKEWVFHLGLAFRRSCFGDGESRAD